MAASPKIQVLERAMAVLDLFTPQRTELTLTEVAGALGMYPSSAHRLLITLESGGLLRRNSATDGYRLGMRLLELASQVMAEFDVRNIAAPHLRVLVHEFQESVALAAYDYGDVVYLDTIAGLHSLNFTTRIGSRHPAHCVASGRSMLAHLPHEVERLLAAGLKPCSERTIVEPAAFRREMKRIRSRGYALDQGDFMYGLRAAASAILDHEERPLAALSVVAPADRFARSRAARAARRVAEVAVAVSDEIRHKRD